MTDIYIVTDACLFSVVLEHFCVSINRRITTSVAFHWSTKLKRRPRCCTLINFELCFIWIHVSQSFLLSDIWCRSVLPVNKHHHCLLIAPLFLFVYLSKSSPLLRSSNQALIVLKKIQSGWRVYLPKQKKEMEEKGKELQNLLR